jgi:hypothetical protein
MHLIGVETRTICDLPLGSLTYGAGVQFHKGYRKVWWLPEIANDNAPRPRRLIYRCCVCGAPAVREMVLGSMQGSASIRDESFWFCSMHLPD